MNVMRFFLFSILLPVMAVPNAQDTINVLNKAIKMAPQIPKMVQTFQNTTEIIASIELLTEYVDNAEEILDSLDLEALSQTIVDSVDEIGICVTSSNGFVNCTLLHTVISSTDSLKDLLGEFIQSIAPKGEDDIRSVCNEGGILDCTMILEVIEAFLKLFSCDSTTLNEVQTIVCDPTASAIIKVVETIVTTVFEIVDGVRRVIDGVSEALEQVEWLYNNAHRLETFAIYMLILIGLYVFYRLLFGFLRRNQQKCINLPRSKYINKGEGTTMKIEGETYFLTPLHSTFSFFRRKPKKKQMLALKIIDKEKSTIKIDGQMYQLNRLNKEKELLLPGSRFMSNHRRT